MSIRDWGREAPECGLRSGARVEKRNIFNDLNLFSSSVLAAHKGQVQIGRAVSPRSTSDHAVAKEI
jgi:hypothetical protein